MKSQLINNVYNFGKILNEIIAMGNLVYIPMK